MRTDHSIALLRYRSPAAHQFFSKLSPNRPLLPPSRNSLYLTPPTLVVVSVGQSHSIERKAPGFLTLEILLPGMMAVLPAQKCPVHSIVFPVYRVCSCPGDTCPTKRNSFHSFLS